MIYQMRLIDSQASAMYVSSGSDDFLFVAWFEPTADSRSDPVATKNSTGVSMATEV